MTAPRKPRTEITRQDDTGAVVRVWTDSPDAARGAAVEAILDHTGGPWGAAIPVQARHSLDGTYYAVTLQPLGHRVRAMKEGFARLEEKREERLKAAAKVLAEHQMAAGAQVASGVTCRCGYWNGVETPGVSRPPGFTGLVWHQAEKLMEAGLL